MGINEAGPYVKAVGIEDFSSVGSKVFADGSNPSILNQDVCNIGLFMNRVVDISVFDQQHFYFTPLSFFFLGCQA